MNRTRRSLLQGAAAMTIAVTAPRLAAQTTPELDRRVRAFLDERRHTWSRGVNYWNVRYEDGQALHDLVVRSRFQRLLEVGTSTGHSGIWLAWAAAKTGGRLTTIEIDRVRHEEAVRNFRLAGVEAYVDARLANAHDLVRELPGPWDLVFQDADKDWYLNYWNDLKGKMAPGGCYTADNVLRPTAREVAQFVEAARRDPAFVTRIDDLGSGEGVLIACRKD
jgi:predicted O-methyltransferase YrrM